jgi:hypothetical protein
MIEPLLAWITNTTRLSGRLVDNIAWFWKTQTIWQLLSQIDCSCPFLPYP